MMFANNSLKRGFTLVELAVVLTIVGVLLYATMTVGAVQLEASRVKQTQDKIEKIQNAMSIYYKVHGYIPCPADGTLAPGDANFGLSPAGCDPLTNRLISGLTTNQAIMGAVPTRTLNLPDEIGIDAWNNKINYSVYSGCTNISSANWATDYSTVDTCQTQSKTGAPNPDLLNVVDKNGNTITSIAAYVLVSQGRNGIGAWKRKGGTRIPRTGSTSAAERINASVATNSAVESFDEGFIDTPIAEVDAGGGGIYFDDIVRWKTPGQIYYDSEH